MDSVRLQAEDMYALQDYIDAQYRGPGKGFFRIVTSPTEARRVVNAGKMAVVLGVEVSEVFDCGLSGDAPLCDTGQIDDRLDELQGLGVSSLFPVHKFDNALGGTAFDEGATGLLVNLGNKYATGEWWDAQPCAPGAEADNTPTDLAMGDERPLRPVRRGGRPAARRRPARLPARSAVQPEGPHRPRAPTPSTRWPTGG